MIKLKIPQYSLQTNILVKIATIIFIAFFVIIGYNTYANREVMRQNTAEFIKRQNDNLISRITSYVKEPKDVAESGASFLASLHEQNNQTVISSYLLRTLKIAEGASAIHATSHHLQMSLIYMDEKDFKKTYSHIKLVDDDHANFILDMQEENSDKTTSLFFDEKLKEIGKNTSNIKKIESLPFFASHVKAMETRQAGWSSVYVQKEHNAPTITYSVPSIANNQTVGAVSVDLNLYELSLFLNEMRISDRTRIFLINEKNQIIADSDLNEQQTVMDTTQTKNEVLAAALSFSQNLKEKNEKKMNSFQIQGHEFLSFETNFQKTSGLEWKLLSISPMHDFTNSFQSVQNGNILIAITSVFLILVFLYFLTASFSMPIKDLGIEAEKIQHLELDDPVSTKSSIYEIQHLASAMQNLKVSVSNFSKYIPKRLVQKFIDNGREVEIGGQACDITLLFSDIAGFTNISESMQAQDLAEHLSSYLDEMSNILHANNATIDKFIGDAIMAFWGAPDPDTNKNVNACRSALLCQKKLHMLNKYWELQGKPVLITRIGIHTGTAMVGNVGSSERMNYTALGDTVNTAARLEGVNKMYGTLIMISESIVKTLGPNFIVRPIDVVAMKGKNKGIRIYELIGLENDPHLDPVSTEHKKFAQLFTQAFELMLARKWKESRKAFEDLDKLNTSELHIENTLIEEYINRCNNFIKSPPPEDWDGTTHLKEK